MRQVPRGEGEETTIPKIGDRVERVEAGVSKSGTVHYSDQMQALVKWDDGSSSSLRLDRDALRILEGWAGPRRCPEAPLPDAQLAEPAA